MTILTTPAQGGWLLGTQQPSQDSDLLYWGPRALKGFKCPGQPPLAPPQPHFRCECSALPQATPGHSSVLGHVVDPVPTWALLSQLDLHRIHRTLPFVPAWWPEGVADPGSHHWACSWLNPCWAAPSLWALPLGGPRNVLYEPQGCCPATLPVPAGAASPPSSLTPLL